MGDDASRSDSIVDQAWPDMDFATLAVGESPIGYARRLRAVAQDINTHYNVEGLCRELPQRVLDLNAAQGGRLGK